MPKAVTTMQSTIHLLWNRECCDCCHPCRELLSQMQDSKWKARLNHDHNQETESRFVQWAYFHPSRSYMFRRLWMKLSGESGSVLQILQEYHLLFIVRWGLFGEHEHGVLECQMATYCTDLSCTSVDQSIPDAANGKPSISQLRHPFVSTLVLFSQIHPFRQLQLGVLPHTRPSSAVLPPFVRSHPANAAICGGLYVQIFGIRGRVHDHHGLDWRTVSILTNPA